MTLAAGALTVLRDPHEDQSRGDGTWGDNPETWPWQYNERNHLSILIQPHDQDLHYIPAKAVVAVVQAVADALEQSLSKAELAQHCMQVGKHCTGSFPLSYASGHNTLRNCSCSQSVLTKHQS